MSMRIIGDQYIDQVTFLNDQVAKFSCRSSGQKTRVPERAWLLQPVLGDGTGPCPVGQGPVPSVAATHQVCKHSEGLYVGQMIISVGRVAVIGTR